MEQIQMVSVEDLHPHEKNPRIDAASVTDLVESIREHGIEVPLVATPAAEGGGYVVLGGHRRLTAALEAGLAFVPAQIRPDLADARDQLAFMATENLHRDQLTAVEESRLVQDMLELGLSQAEVAKQTALGKKRVAERVKLSKLAEETGDKVHRGQITVDDALVIAEYSDDPEIAEQLEDAAGTYNFDWTVSRAKQRRELAEAIETAKKTAKKKGIRLVDEDADFVGLNELLQEVGWTTPALEAYAATGADEDDEWRDLVHAEHAKCPGHSAEIIQFGPDRGGLRAGCDQVATQHADTTPATAEPEPEPADPWDDITAEEFEAARIHREQHLAKTLPTTVDLADDARDLAIKGVVQMGWGQYMDDPRGISFLQAITGVEGKTKVTKALRAWPLDVLVWIGANDYALRSHHHFMTEGKQGSTYWAKDGVLRQLLERTGYAWSEPEQQAILLATGVPHDATEDGADDGADGAALAEGGEQR